MRVKKLVPVLMFVMAVVTSFAFRSVESNNKKFHPCTWFVYNGPQPATLADARNPNNYTFSALTPTCNGGTRLCAICVPASEIYPNGTGTADDKPKVDDSTTPSQIYTELGNAFNPITGNWTAVDHPNNTVIHIATKN